MDRASFLDGLAAQKAYCEKRSPLYFGLLSAFEGDLRSGPTAWFERLSSAWKGRDFQTPYEAPLLLLASLHLEAIKGEKKLGSVYPTCGGADVAGAPAAVRRYLAAAPSSFWETVRKARLQTNEATRSVGWMLPACVGFMVQSLPFHLVDMGTSAGLNLVGDYLERSWLLRSQAGDTFDDPPHWRDVPFPVLSRIGLDGAPRRLADADDRLWLKACIWADDAARHERFDKAAAMFLSLARMSTGPRLHACEFKDMPAWVARNLKPHSEEGLLLFNSQATDFLSDAEYAGLQRGIAEALKPWGERALWIELELPRGDRKAFHELRAHRLREGKLETRVLGTAAAHPSEVRLRPGWDFLLPGEPVRKRFTIEEPHKTLQPGVYKFPMPPKG